MIVFSRTQYSTTDSCWRQRWLGYEAPNGTEGQDQARCPSCGFGIGSIPRDTKLNCAVCLANGTTVEMLHLPPVYGWQRRSHAIPLATGAWTHKGLEHLLSGMTPYEAAIKASDEYRMIAYERGLDCAGDMSFVIEEQATLVAGLVYAWGLVRWPQVQHEWEVLHVEREGVAKLADDVSMQYRPDWIGRRRSDSQVFIWNFKTLSLLDERWLKGWEIDSQVLTEAWAVEAELGHTCSNCQHAKDDHDTTQQAANCTKCGCTTTLDEWGAGFHVAGVIIEGLIKGSRRKDKDEFGQTIGERQQSVLCYGYHAAGNPPLTPPEWTHEYKRGKGWQRFGVGSPGQPTFNEWVDALPREVLEGLFVTVPPVYRNDAKVLSKLTQMVSREREIALRAEETRRDPDTLDQHFPQNERSCLWPSRCPFFDACHVANVSDDMLGSGLYMPREANHPVLVGGDE